MRKQLVWIKSFEHILEHILEHIFEHILEDNTISYFHKRLKRKSNH